MRSKSTSLVYEVSPYRWQCTCPGFKYSKYPNRGCTHLRSLASSLDIKLPVFGIISTGTKIPFQEVSDYIPTDINKLIESDNWNLDVD